MIKQVLLSLPLLMIVACSAKEPENTPDNQPANNETDNGSESNGADSKAADSHGTEHPLLKVKLKEFGRLIKITQLGEIEAGKEGAIMIAFNISAERISNVRAWIGIEGGSGLGIAMRLQPTVCLAVLRECGADPACHMCL
ncbi:MAG TPA: hypothetical protein EYP98_17220, partial [Planctomycetes bacterium]|nr:hypothetical protein [Planctomycetota bacterium]